MARTDMSLDDFVVSDGEVVLVIGDDRVRLLDAEALETRWGWEVSEPEAQFGSILEDIVIVLFGRDTWRGLDRATGATRWEVTADFVFDIGQSAELPEFVLAHGSEGFSRIDPEDGTSIWRRPGPPSLARLASGERLVIDEGIRTVVLDGATGEVLHEVETPTARYTLGLVGDRLVQLDPADNLGLDAGTVVITDASTGEMVFEETVQSAVPVGEAVLMADDTSLRQVDVETATTLWTRPRNKPQTVATIPGPGGTLWVAVVDEAAGQTDYLDSGTGEVIMTQCGGDLTGGFVDGRAVSVDDAGSWTFTDPTGATLPGSILGMAESAFLTSDPFLVRVGIQLHRLELPSRPADDGVPVGDGACGGSTRTQVLATEVDEAVVTGGYLVTVSGDTVSGIPLGDTGEGWQFDGSTFRYLLWATDGMVGLASRTEPDAVMLVLDAGTGESMWSGPPGRVVNPIGGGLGARDPGEADRVTEVVDLRTGEVVHRVLGAGDLKGLEVVGDQLVVTGTHRVTVVDLATSESSSRAVPDVQQATISGGQLVSTVGGSLAAGIVVRSSIADTATWSSAGAVDLFEGGVLVSWSGVTTRHDLETGDVVWSVDAGAHRLVRGPRSSFRETFAEPADLVAPALVTFQFGGNEVAAELRDLGTGAVIATWEGVRLRDQLMVGATTIVSVPGFDTVGARRPVAIRDRVTGELLGKVPISDRRTVVNLVSADPVLVMVGSEVIEVVLDDLGVAAMLGQLRQ